MTKDSDLAIDPRELASEPLIEAAMRSAGFELDPERNQPGIWVGPENVPIDLLVPESLAGAGRRSARVPPHLDRAMRRAVGLEAAVVDRRRMPVASLTEGDARKLEIWVASPTALLISKLHKISEREERPDRLNDKDAHDIYRLLVAVPTNEFATSLDWLKDDPFAGEVTRSALASFERLFASGPAALGSILAGRAELGVGAPDVVAASVAALAADVLAAAGGEK